MEIPSDLFCFVTVIMTIFGADWCPPLDKEDELIPVCCKPRLDVGGLDTAGREGGGEGRGEKGGEGTAAIHSHVA